MNTSTWARFGRSLERPRGLLLAADQGGYMNLRWPSGSTQSHKLQILNRPPPLSLSPSSPTTSLAQTLHARGMCFIGTTFYFGPRFDRTCQMPTGEWLQLGQLVIVRVVRGHVYYFVCGRYALDEIQ